MKKILSFILRWIVIPSFFVLVGVVAAGYFLIDATKSANDNANWYDPVTGINESYHIDIGGVQQFIQIRGQDRSNPVLVFLHGGPGQPMRIIGYKLFKLWPEYFTVVDWDQRGSGESGIDKETESDSINMDQMVSDAIEVIEHVKVKLEVEKVILVGHSWGTILGINVVGKRPDLFYAYANFGHGVKFQDRAQYIRQAAMGEGDQETATAMSGVIENWAGKGDRDGFVSSIFEMNAYAGNYDQGIHAVKHPGDDMDVLLPVLIGSPDVSAFDFVKNISDSIETYKPLIDYLYDMDLSKELNENIEVPLFFFQGKYEVTTPFVKKWVDAIAAPNKTYVELERSGHVMFHDEPGKILVELVNNIRPHALIE